MITHDRLKRGDRATALATGRDVQVLRVVEVGGQLAYECRSLRGVPEDDRVYHATDVIRCIGLAPVLPPE